MRSPAHNNSFLCYYSALPHPFFIEHQYNVDSLLSRSAILTPDKTKSCTLYLGTTQELNFFYLFLFSRSERVI